MSSSDPPETPEGLRPLSASEDPQDQLLALRLTQMYSDRPPAAAPGWDAIADQALTIARSRRRRYLATELLSSIGGSRRLLLCACAAGLLLTLGLQLRQPAPAAPPLAEPQAHLQGDAYAGRRTRLLDGAELLLLGGTIAVDQARPRATRVALHTGTLRVSVPRLPEHGTLVVTTSDAEVIVHGTRFDVIKRGTDSTGVAVLEGLVEVRPLDGARQPVFLRPGEHLEVLSPAHYRAQVAQRVELLVTASRCDDPDGIVDTHLRLAPPGTDLSAVRYLQGFCAVQRGDSDQAVHHFEQVAASSTNPTRADNALARVAQLQAAQNPESGAAAWRRYLARFPQGVHHTAAQEFLANRGTPVR